MSFAAILMKIRIEPYNAQHRNAIIRLSLQAWAPVFESLQQVMDAGVYQAFFPDWRVSQQKSVEEACAAEDAHVWVALNEGSVVGFVAVKLHSEDCMGEVYMIAIDPDFQRQGIGTVLMEFALNWMKEAGMSIAMVETGGDPGHAPARRTYEKLGFGLLPIARYFKKL